MLDQTLDSEKRDAEVHCIQFDQNWRISDWFPTIMLFEREAFDWSLSDHPVAVRGLIINALGYRSTESVRYIQHPTLIEGMELYHTHGLVSGFAMLKMLRENAERFHKILAGGLTEKKLLTLGIAATDHDVGGELEGDDKGAAAKVEHIQRLVKSSVADETLAEEIITDVNSLLGFTNYETSDRPAYFDPRTGDWSLNEQMSTEGLLMVVADFLQLGAVDYKEKVVRDLTKGSNEYKLPTSIALLFTTALKELATRIGIEKAYELIPSEMRARIIELLTDVESYDQNFLAKKVGSEERYSKEEILLKIWGDLGIINTET